MKKQWGGYYLLMARGWYIIYMYVCVASGFVCNFAIFMHRFNRASKSLNNAFFMEISLAESNSESTRRFTPAKCGGMEANIILFIHIHQSCFWFFLEQASLVILGIVIQEKKKKGQKGWQNIRRFFCRTFPTSFLAIF